MEEDINKEKNGDFVVGFLLGFFLDIIGVAIAYSSCGKRTKRGAFYGFIAFAIIVLLVIVLSFALNN